MKKTIFLLIACVVLFAGAKTMVGNTQAGRDITPKDAQTLLNQGKAVLYDIREPEELLSSSIPGAVHRPRSMIASLPQDHDPTKEAIFICRSGNRTTRYASILEAWAKKTPLLVTGGILAWEKDGLPVSKQH